ncbi:MAG: ParA family protein [Spirochaetota bacterium]|nr:ParA family protein [Spirochaetota bacterium]
MLFMTVDEYAKKDNVSLQAIYDRVNQGKLGEVDLAHKTPKLVFDKDKLEKGYVIAFSNLKGGCGKTTIACHTAALLSKVGFKVLLIDTDHQNQCESFFPEREYEYTINDVFLNNNNIKNCIYKTKTNTSFLDIIFSDYKLAIKAPEIKDRDILSKSIKEIKNQYDFIIIDTSPNFDIITQNVVRAANGIIIPMIPHPLHLKGLNHNLSGLEEVAEVPTTERILGILLNIYDRKQAIHRDTITLLTSEESYKKMLFETVIPTDPQLPKVTLFNTTIFDFKENSTSSQAFKKMLFEALRRIK